MIDELLDELWPADPEPSPTDADPRTPREKLTGLPGPPRQASSPAPVPVGNRPAAPRAASSSPPGTRTSTRSRPELGELDADGVRRRRWPADPEAAAALLADLAVATDAQLRAAARRLAGRVFLRLAGSARRRSRGTRRLGPSRALDGDLDLDRTLDALGPGRVRRPGADDLVTRTWTAHRRAVCLVVDISGSMQGLAVALAAVAAAGVVVANEHGPPALEPSVLAFGAGVRVLQRAGRAPPAGGAALRAGRAARARHHRPRRRAARGVARSSPGRSPTSGWSCCSRTACTPPATTRPSALGGIDRLHVLVPLGGAEAEAAAAALAARGGGRAQTVRGWPTIGPALTRILA